MAHRLRARQEGNAMVLALLALVVTGLGATTALHNRRLELKREAGRAEATVLDQLRNGAQALVDEHLAALQQGEPVAKAGVTVTPSDVGGDLVWSPSVAQLRDMGYLPAGWQTTHSMLNAAAYAVTLRRTPAGCAPTACDIEGAVVLMGPLLDGGPGAPTDGVTIGPILTHAGATGGVSLPMTTGTISGFDGTWALPNPVPGTPAGVVALRFGTQTGGMSQFVRVGDLRDPMLRGSLTTAGAFSTGGSATVAGSATVEGPTDLRGGVQVGPAGAPCVTVAATGSIVINCNGTVTAQSAVFGADPANQTRIDAGTVASSGVIRAAAGFHSGSSTLFEAAEPNALSVAATEFRLRGSSGSLATFRDGNIEAPATISARTFELRDSVVEGSFCGAGSNLPGTQLGVTAGGGLALCISSRWTAVFRLETAGDSCQSAGILATDRDDGQSIVCKGGRFLRTEALLSRFTLEDTVALDMRSGPVEVVKPQCKSTGANPAQALIMVSPNNEDVPALSSGGLSGVNRYALDLGASWLVALERSGDGSILPGNLVAHIYCYFG